jgi:hypothetical protein
VLKSEIERTTTDDFIQIGTSQVKLGEEFNRLVIINDQADTIMEDVTPDHEEEKTDKVVVPSICSQEAILPILLTPKSESFNDYSLRRYEKRSERSSGMNCLMRSSLGPCRSKNGRGRKHLKALLPSQLPVVRL